MLLYTLPLRPVTRYDQKQPCAPFPFRKFDGGFLGSLTFHFGHHLIHTRFVKFFKIFPVVEIINRKHIQTVLRADLSIRKEHKLEFDSHNTVVESFFLSLYRRRGFCWGFIVLPFGLVAGVATMG